MKGDLGKETYGGALHTLRTRLDGGLSLVFRGGFWRSVNIIGTIVIANGVRQRVQPYIEEYNTTDSLIL